jgi:hypothetical protein
MDKDLQRIVSIRQTIPEVKQLINQLKKIHPDICTDLEYFLFMLQKRENVVKPYVIILEQNGNLETLFIGSIEHYKYNCKIGPIMLYKQNVRSLTIYNTNIKGIIDQINGKILISEIIKCLKNKKADLAYFIGIPTDSKIHEFGNKLNKIFIKDYFPELNYQFKLTLPDSIEDFYRTRKIGFKEAKKNLRRLNKKYEGNVELKVYETKEDVKKICEDMEEISKKTYQYTLGVGFKNNIEKRSQLHFFAERGRIKVFILYIAGKPSAFWSGYINRGSYEPTFGGTGYDPKYKKYGIGKIAMLKAIENLCEDSRIKYINYGIGDIKQEISLFYIFQPTLRGFGLNTMRIICGTSQSLGKMVLDRLHMMQKWKKFRRK